jgi:hypothetical protein
VLVFGPRTAADPAFGSTWRVSRPSPPSLAKLVAALFVAKCLSHETRKESLGITRRAGAGAAIGS